MKIPKTYMGKKVTLDKSRKIQKQKGYAISGSKVKGSKFLLFAKKSEALKFTKRIGGKPQRAFRKSVPILTGKKKGWVTFPKSILIKK